MKRRRYYAGWALEDDPLTVVVVDDESTSQQATVELLARRDEAARRVREAAREYRAAMEAADAKSGALTDAMKALHALNRERTGLVTDRFIAEQANLAIPPDAHAFGRELKVTVMKVRGRTGTARDARRPHLAGRRRT